MSNALLQPLLRVCQAAGAAVLFADSQNCRLQPIATAGNLSWLQETAFDACRDCAAAPHDENVDTPCVCDQLTQRDHSLQVLQLRYRGLRQGVLALSRQNSATPIESAWLSALTALWGRLLDAERQLIEQRQLEELRLRTSLIQEHRLIANEVHDSLAQNLTFMRMRVSLIKDALHGERSETPRALAYLDEIEESLTIAHGRVREIIAQYRSVAAPGGLIKALRKEIAHLNGLNGVELTLVTDQAELSLTAQQEIQVWHIVREALSNVVRHARARHGQVTISRDKDGYQIEIRDDGIGLRTSEDERHGHYGLNIMQERAHCLAGELTIQNAEGAGTRILLRFPPG